MVSHSAMVGIGRLVLFADKKLIIDKFYRFCLVEETVEQSSGQELLRCCKPRSLGLGTRLISADPMQIGLQPPVRFVKGRFADIPDVSGQGLKPIELGDDSV
jgi:hypothetical protein